MIKVILIAMLSGTLFLQCNTRPRAEKKNTVAVDTIMRPANLSPNASLINIGDIDAPVYRWYEYGGTVTGKKLKAFYYDGRAKNISDNRVFDDIHIINAYYPNGKLEISDLFQVFPREQKLSIATTDNYSIIDWWGTNTLKIETVSGAFILVGVFNLEHSYTREDYLGHKFEHVPSITRFFSDKMKAESYRLGETISVSIKKTEESNVYDVLIVTVTGKEKMQKYKLITMEQQPINMSVIRYYDPLQERIYFVEDGYLEALKN